MSLSNCCSKVNEETHEKLFLNFILTNNNKNNKQKTQNFSYFLSFCPLEETLNESIKNYIKWEIRERGNETKKGLHLEMKKIKFKKKINLWYDERLALFTNEKKWKKMLKNW